MKIALIGYGKMGKIVEQIALQKGHAINVKIDPKCHCKTITRETLSDSDICIDFTQPSDAIENLKQVAKCGKSIVMGTTGWYEHLEEAKRIVEYSKIGFLYAPNFSLGVALFLNIVSQAAAIIAPFENYDVNGFEIHHQKKMDAPSGTASAISRELHANFPNRNKIDFTSIRVGSVPGTHTVLFDSSADTITLTHTARNREGFAEGAIKAAEWLQGKKGVFTLDDIIIGNYNE